MRRWNAAALTVLFAGAGAFAALAHGKMASTVPGDGATVPTGLSEIELNFSKPMRLTLVELTRARVQRPAPTKGELPKSFVTSAKVAVEPLPDGAYEVSWTAVADDGHVMNGNFKFSVGDGKDAKAAQ